MGRAQMSSILPVLDGFVISRGSFHLRLIEKLGHGAYGVVYLGQDVSPDAPEDSYYAVKCLLRHPNGSDLARQQERELENHSRVSDLPNVVTLRDVIEEDQYTFIVLDYCDGGDLFSAVTEHDTYLHNTAAVKRTFVQIIDALAACHERGVFHRDLKPENILCSYDGSEVFVADFGLSTRSKRSRKFGCGSSFYMSPECLGIYVEKRAYETGPSDVWALGTILCNLLTGRNPWHIASPRTDNGFRSYLKDGPQWLLSNLSISIGAAAILGRIFELDPHKRITLPNLRDAILGLDTFYADAEPSVATAAESNITCHNEIREVPRVRSASPQPQEVDITEARRRSSVLPHEKASCELRPISLASRFSTDFMSDPTEGLAVAASATLAGVDSSSVTDNRSRSQDSEELAQVWSTDSTPSLADFPQTSESADDSEGPITPETIPTASVGNVSELELDMPPTAHLPPCICSNVSTTVLADPPCITQLE
ncbi:Pkinase-domain-containing protein [Daedaleopsis nitida]|nr:Pkinase-domain-containing protein [Daedaleopsis nitida]